MDTQQVLPVQIDRPLRVSVSPHFPDPADTERNAVR